MSTNTDISGSNYIDISANILSTNTINVSTNVVSTITNISSSSVFDISNLMFLYQPSTNISTISDPSDVPFTFEDLINSQQVIINKETEDRGFAYNFATMSIESIKPQLYNWASVGFPGAYGVATLSLQPPAICSDGVPRQLVEYYTWLIGMSIEQWLDSMNKKTSGMVFTFSHNGSMNINLHITKTISPMLY